jgi:UPF0755 protein
VARDVSDAAPPTPAPSPRGRDRRRLRRRRILLAIGVVVVVLAIPITWFLLQAYPLGSSGPDALIYVAPGEPMSQIATALSDKGVISSDVAFRIDLELTGQPTVGPGWYAIARTSSFSSVKAVLGAGPNAVAVEVTSGETSREMAVTLTGVEDQAFAAGFLHLALTGGVHSAFSDGSLEGLLAPGTYVLTHDEDPRTLITQMLTRFETGAARLGLTPSTRDHGLDAYQLITVASIVEKEGYYRRNMPKVATVIYNRLDQGMPLQMDSTVEYAIGQDGGPVTSHTESIRSPYNTYLHAGLTPTPICSPSPTALRAALHPPSGPWLFFTLVSTDGTMAFASTFAQQLANEQIGLAHGVP